LSLAPQRGLSRFVGKTAGRPDEHFGRSGTTGLRRRVKDMTHGEQVWRLAIALVGRHGAGAAGVALERAHRCAAAGTPDYATWLSVAEAAARLLEADPGPGEYVQ
jgi:hypothetical protein